MRNSFWLPQNLPDLPTFAYRLASTSLLMSRSAPKALDASTQRMRGSQQETWMNKHTGTQTSSLCGLGLFIGAQLLSACSSDLDGSHAEEISAASISKGEGAVILGSVDWQEASSLAEGTAARQNARAVAYLNIPAVASRCTAFLIAPDVIMTNQHCIPDAASAQGVTAYFHYEQGGSTEVAVDCSGFIGNDAALDYALLQCASRPGDTLGTVDLENRNARTGERVYVIHQNCDYFSDPNCAPTKKLSAGTVQQVGNEVGHSADTLGGSSGSPVFAGDTHTVIALHHAGAGSDANGRGSMNYAVPMTRILPVLLQRYPGLQLGGRAPTPTAPTAPTTPTTTDLYEPNDTRAGATVVQLPFSSQDASIDANDDDVFTFTSDGRSLTIRMTCSHAQGDLDMYVYDATGAELARSIGTSGVELISQGFPAGAVFVRVIGYREARGAYTLSVQ